MTLENDFFRLLNKNDEDAIQLIFDAYYNELCLYASVITKNFEIAEEVVEDVFINLWKNKDELTITKSLKGYLYKSTYNGSLKALKAGIPGRKMENNDEDIFKTSMYADPESEFILKELEDKAQEIYKSLPPRCREIYFLNRFENLTYPQIASRLNVSLGTVKTQMFRAFNKFRQEFRKYLYFF
jgi:RNA polymerase sigma-70 factor, ECF subfamily